MRPEIEFVRSWLKLMEEGGVTGKIIGDLAEDISLYRQFDKRGISLAELDIEEPCHIRFTAEKDGYSYEYARKCISEMEKEGYIIEADVRSPFINKNYEHRNEDFHIIWNSVVICQVYLGESAICGLISSREIEYPNINYILERHKKIVLSSESSAWDVQRAIFYLYRSSYLDEIEEYKVSCELPAEITNALDEAMKDIPEQWSNKSVSKGMLRLRVYKALSVLFYSSMGVGERFSRKIDT